MTVSPDRTVDGKPFAPRNGEPRGHFASTDIDETQVFLTELLRRDLVLEPLLHRQFSTELVGYGFASANLVQASYPGGMRLRRGEAHDNLTVRIVTSGGTLYSVDNETLAAVPGRGLVLNTALAETGEYAQGSVHATFTIHAEEVARTLEAVFQRPAGGRLEIAASFDAKAGVGAALAGIMAVAGAASQDETTFDQAPHAQRMLRDTMIMLILEHFPHRYSSWFESRASAPAPWQIRQALAYIDGHTSGPLTIQDVAEAVGIGLRSLQEGFRRHKGIAPHEYIKLARLNGVRAELLDPACTRSIEAVAHHWGFFNRGHFALDYRRAFGERPSQTRRAR